MGLNCAKRDGLGLVRTDDVRVPLAATMVYLYVLYFWLSSASRSQIAGPKEGGKTGDCNYLKWLNQDSRWPMEMG